MADTPERDPTGATADLRGEAGWLRKAMKFLGIAAQAGAEDAPLAWAPRLLDLLEKWNAAIRLVGQRDRAEWPEQHVLDSLTPLLLVDAEARGRARAVVDIGAGAGFPGLPLAAVVPAWRFTLVEANQKKATFIRTAAAALALENVTVLARRAEERPAPIGDWVISRALAPPDAWLPIARPWLAPGGAVLAMLGRDQPDDAALAALGTAHELRFERIHRLVLPRSQAQRAIVVWTDARS